MQIVEGKKYIGSGEDAILFEEEEQPLEQMEDEECSHSIELV